MSKAGPMEPEARGLIYTEMFSPDGEHAGWRRRMTPRQGRRFWHKLNRFWGGYELVSEDTPEARRPKGCPTPRQRKPRRDG